MAKFCRNCGSEINENADICLNCGVLINKNNNDNSNMSGGINPNPYPYNYSYPNNNQVVNMQNKVPGNGSSIAGMVLGIVAAFWTICELLSVLELDSTSFGYYYNMSKVIQFAIGYTLFALVPSIIGLCLSASGYKKSKNGFNISGLLLNLIALLLNVIIFIYILSLY